MRLRRDTVLLQPADCSVTIPLQEVYTQVNRCARSQRLGHVFRLRAKAAREHRPEPLRDIVFLCVALKCANMRVLRLVQWGGRMSLPCKQVCWINALIAARANHHTPPRLSAPQGSIRPAAPQRLINMITHGGAVL